MDSVVAVHGIHGDRESTWMLEESNQQPGSQWLHQIYEDNPSSRVMTFGYDSSRFGTGLCKMGRFKDAALQLLDDLVELRRGPDLVAVYILWNLVMSIGMGQPANISYHRIRGVQSCSSLMTWEVSLSKR